MRLIKLLGGYILIFFGLIGIVATVNEADFSIVEFIMNLFIVVMGVVTLFKRRKVQE